MAPKAFKGLPSPFTDALRTRWCDGCILRMREYCELLDFKGTQKQELNRLYESWLDHHGFRTYGQEKSVREAGRKKDVGCDYSLGSAGLYWKLRRKGVSDNVRGDEKVIEIKEQILELRIVLEDLKGRMEARVEQLEERLDMKRWNEAREIVGFRTRREWQWFGMEEDGGESERWRVLEREIEKLGEGIMDMKRENENLSFRRIRTRGSLGV